MAIVPASVFAANQAGIEPEAKQKLDAMIEQIQEDIDKATTPEEINRLEKLLDGVQDLKAVISIGEQLKTATDSGKAELEASLAAKIDELKEHAGDRSIHTDITDVEQSDQDSGNQSDGASAQSAWLPQASPAMV